MIMRAHRLNIFKALRDEEDTLTWGGVGVIWRRPLYEAQSTESASIELFVRYFMGALLSDTPQFEDPNLKSSTMFLELSELSAAV